MTSNIYRETVKNFYWKMAHGRFTAEQEKAIERALTLCAEIDIKQLEALVEEHDVSKDVKNFPQCRYITTVLEMHEIHTLLTKILRGLKG